MNTKEKYEDIKVSMINEKTRDTLDKLRRATKDFSVENEKANAFVSAVHDKLKKEKPDALRSEDKKPEPKPEPKKAEPKKAVPKKPAIKEPEPKKPEPAAKPSKTVAAQVKASVIKLDEAIATDPLLKGLGKTDKERDAVRIALPRGRRVSKKGVKNQYGASKGGRVYYESRENRSDRKSPDYKSGYPYLEMGGFTHKNDEGGEFFVNIYMEENGEIKDIQQREFRDEDSAMTFAMMKGNFLNMGQSIFVMDDEGNVLYKKVSMKSNMAQGGAIKNQYKGREAEDIWNNFTSDQRQHFIYDHAEEIGELKERELKSAEIRTFYKSSWSDLDEDAKNRFENHVREGQYVDGGFMANGGFMAKGGKLLTTRQRYIAELKGLSGSVKPIAIDNFIEENKLTDDEILNLVIGLGRKQIERADFVTAIVGNKNNEEFKKIMAFIKSDKAMRAADGGMMATKGDLEQGFNDRLDESMKKMESKSSKINASFKDRRNESKGESKALGNRPYSRVHTMDKMKKGGTVQSKDKLPYELNKYFTKPKDTIEIELSSLIPTRARIEGIENAERLMRMAYDGKQDKRKPITIYKSRNKKYRIADGNSTFAVAKKQGWETIFAQVIENPNIKERKEKSVFTIAKQIRKAGEPWKDAVKRASNANK